MQAYRAKMVARVHVPGTATLFGSEHFIANKIVTNIRLGNLIMKIVLSVLTFSYIGIYYYNGTTHKYK